MGTMKYVFKSDLLASNRCEQRFANWLQSKGMRNIYIVPNTEAIHDYDIKTSHDTYEIKFDRWFEKTGNICVETVSNNKTGSLGWFMLTKAKWLIVFYNETQFYGMSMDYLRDMWFKFPEIWRRLDVKQDTGYTTTCWLAPITEFIQIKTGDTTR